MPTIDHKAFTGTNANSTAGNTVSLAYNHPGGHLLVVLSYIKGSGGTLNTSTLIDKGPR